MKKLLLLLIFTSIASCSISKNLKLGLVRDYSKQTESTFLENKLNAVKFLNLSQTQLNQCYEIWKNEKLRLGQINLKDDQEVASIVYKSEIDFRNVLTSDQLTLYKAETINNQTMVEYFMGDKTLGEIKKFL